MATTNTATGTRRITLNEIVAMKDGTSVRVVRIRAGHVCYQDAAIKLIAGVPARLLGYTSAPIARFAALVAK